MKEFSLLEKTISKTCLYNFDPLKPHLYIVKLGFTGVYIIYLISAQKHRLWVDCGYSLEPPRRGGSNEYPQYVFSVEIWKISEFLSENFHFLLVKFSVYLNRHVFVICLHFTETPFQKGLAMQESIHNVITVTLYLLHYSFSHRDQSRYLCKQYRSKWHGS